MIPRNIEPSPTPSSGHSLDLANGVPTIWGLASLAAQALAGHADPCPRLSLEANVLLACAKTRGIFEVRGQPDAFDSTERLLAIAVEITEGRWLVFREKANPRKTLAYLEGFRQLCQAGLVMHQLHREFSLTVSGFEAAAVAVPENLEQETEWAVAVEY